MHPSAPLSLATNKSLIVKQVCEALTAGEIGQAAALAQRDYPFQPLTQAKRTFSPSVSTRIFCRDGFIDRYKGTRLIFPGALRLLSRLLPAEFPVHPNGKLSVSHIIHWELYPCIDHITPIARGGPDREDNWLTTSMMVNGVKANWTLEELSWTKLEPGKLEEWDGLVGWFLDYLRRAPEHLSDKYLRRWHSPAQRLVLHRL